MDTEHELQKQFTDISNKKIRVGQRVILNIRDGEEYLGEISAISKDQTRIQLTNISLGKNNEQIFGHRQFYRPEINSIEIVTETDLKETIEDSTDTTEDTIQQYEKFELFDSEFEVIDSMIRNRVYINQKNQAFEDAIKDISKQDFVSLFAEGVENGRNDKLTLLDTPHKIYVMDFTSMAIDVALSDLLMFDKPVKVMHDASLLFDNLYHCHGIKLKEVFDTMIAHMALGYSDARSTLSQCIAEHMILPLQYMDAFKPIEVQECTEELIENCSRKVAIILKFHGFLTETLLKNAYASFDKNLNYSRNCSTVELGNRYTLIKANEIKLNLIPPFKLNVRQQ